MPENLSLTDVVPQLRVDLSVSEPAQGAGEQTVNVTEAVNGVSMKLRGFELSIARMLNGQRTVEEVLQAAAQVGLPLSLESLSSFVRKLKTAGFLVEPGESSGSPPPVGSMWEPRAEWTDETRRRYQSALKDARADRLEVARGTLRQLLGTQPDVKEAQALLQWVEQKLMAGPEAQKSPSFAQMYAEVERTWFADGERQSQENEVVQSELAAMPPQRAASKVPFVIVGVLLAAAAVGLNVPYPYKVKATYELAPRATTPVTVPRAGVVAKVSAANGQWVDKGAELVTFDTATAKKKLAEAEVKLAQAQKKLSALHQPSKKAADAKKAFDKAEAEEKKAAAALEKERTKAKNKRTAAVTKAEKKHQAATDKVAKAKKALDAFANTEKSATAERELQALTAERDTAKAASEAAPVVAPAAGFVAGLSLKEGAAVEAGATVCALEDSKALKVKLSLDAKGADAVKEGQRAALTIDGKPVSATLAKVVGQSAEGTLDNAAGLFKAGAHGSATIDAEGKSVLSRM